MHQYLARWKTGWWNWCVWQHCGERQGCGPGPSSYVLFLMIIVMIMLMLMIHHPRGNERMKSKATMTFRAVGFLKKLVLG